MRTVVTGLFFSMALCHFCNAAEINCQILENNIVVDQKTHLIEQSAADNQFELDFGSGRYQAQFLWSYESFSLELKDTTQGTFNLSTGHWVPWGWAYAALPDNAAKTPSAVAHCQMNTSDGKDPIFDEYKISIRDNAQFIKNDVALVTNLAKLPPQSSSDEQELDRSICDGIGQFTNGKDLSNYLNLILPLTDNESERFPDLYTLALQQLLGKSLLLTNFCAPIYADSDPIPMGNRAILLARAQEIPAILDKISAYLDSN